MSLSSDEEFELKKLHEYALRVSGIARRLLKQECVGARLVFGADKYWSFEVAVQDALSEMDRMAYLVGQEMQYGEGPNYSSSLTSAHFAQVKMTVRNFLFSMADLRRLDAVIYEMAKPYVKRPLREPEAGNFARHSRPYAMWVYRLADLIPAVPLEAWVATVLRYQVDTSVLNDSRFKAHVQQIPLEEAVAAQPSTNISFTYMADPNSYGVEVEGIYCPKDKQHRTDNNGQFRLHVCRHVDWARNPGWTDKAETPGGYSLAYQLSFIQEVREAILKMVEMPEVA